MLNSAQGRKKYTVHMKLYTNANELLSDKNIKSNEYTDRLKIKKKKILRFYQSNP